MMNWIEKYKKKHGQTIPIVSRPLNPQILAPPRCYLQHLWLNPITLALYSFLPFVFQLSLPPGFSLLWQFPCSLPECSPELVAASCYWGQGQSCYHLCCPLCHHHSCFAGALIMPLILARAFQQLWGYWPLSVSQAYTVYSSLSIVAAAPSPRITAITPSLLTNEPSLIKMDVTNSKYHQSSNVWSARGSSMRRCLW